MTKVIKMEENPRLLVPCSHAGEIPAPHVRLFLTADGLPCVDSVECGRFVPGDYFAYRFLTGSGATKLAAFESTEYRVTADVARQTGRVFTISFPASCTLNLVEESTTTGCRNGPETGKPRARAVLMASLT